MIVLLLNTRNEAELLRLNVEHHLEWGFDKVAIGDDDSTDGTQDVVREFGDHVVYRRYSGLERRQLTRHQLLQTLGPGVTWALVADTDEFLWAPAVAGPGTLLSEVPDDVVAVNTDQKLFVPTARDDDGLPVMAAREYWSPAGTLFHSSYGHAGKTFYRAGRIGRAIADHWSSDVPHPKYQLPEPSLHHYMMWSEDRFVSKVATLTAWAHIRNPLKWLKWKVKTPHGQLPRFVGDQKANWYSIYATGGEDALRRYYRDVYTISENKISPAIERGDLVHDPAFARYVRDWDPSAAAFRRGGQDAIGAGTAEDASSRR